MKDLPADYLERVYAGVLGKMVGVYLGRPVEGWTYERIMAEVGDVDGYINHLVPGNPPLVVTDDDLAGTFVFLRALREHGYDAHLTPAQIGDTWLNQLIEPKTILWWGGLGCSTEHTAYLRLKDGIKAPDSGSATLNGKIISEQIGAQIFIDGWAMLWPGDPERAVDWAGRAASVSHDGEAVYGAQMLAAMEAQAFVEQDIETIIDTGLALIPRDSILYRMIQDVRGWYAGEPDWHRTRAKIAQMYGYDRYKGVCHMVPNHAVILLGLLYGQGDFHRSMRVVNTAGWDTDCNAGNLGCLLGIRGGLTAFTGGPDWLGPLADRLFLVSAEGGEAVTDALRCAGEVVNTSRAVRGLPLWQPKAGARFHFEAPGSVQGFRAETPAGEYAHLQNVEGHSRSGSRSLAVRWKGSQVSLLTPVFILPDEREISWYAFLASPGLYAGQTLQAGISSEQICRARLGVRYYNGQDQLEEMAGPVCELVPGVYQTLSWQVPDMHGQPLVAAGILLDSGAEGGAVYLDWMDWTGEPDVRLGIPAGANPAAGQQAMWRRAWVNGVSDWNTFFPEAYRLSQNQGRGLLMQGSRGWRNYRVSVSIRSALMKTGGVAVRVQGMRRYYALLLTAHRSARLVKVRDEEQVLVEIPFDWQAETDYQISLQAQDNRLTGWIDGKKVIDFADPQDELECGGTALVIEEGHLACEEVTINPI